MIARWESIWKRTKAFGLFALMLSLFGNSAGADSPTALAGQWNSSALEKAQRAGRLQIEEINAKMNAAFPPIQDYLDPKVVVDAGSTITLSGLALLYQRRLVERAYKSRGLKLSELTDLKAQVHSNLDELWSQLDVLDSQIDQTKLKLLQGIEAVEADPSKNTPAFVEYLDQQALRLQNEVLRLEVSNGEMENVIKNMFRFADGLRDGRWTSGLFESASEGAISNDFLSLKMTEVRDLLKTGIRVNKDQASALYAEREWVSRLRDDLQSMVKKGEPYVLPASLETFKNRPDIIELARTYREASTLAETMIVRQNELKRIETEVAKVQKQIRFWKGPLGNSVRVLVSAPAFFILANDVGEIWALTLGRQPGVFPITLAPPDKQTEEMKSWFYKAKNKIGPLWDDILAQYSAAMLNWSGPVR